MIVKKEHEEKVRDFLLRALSVAKESGLSVVALDTWAISVYPQSYIEDLLDKYLIRHGNNNITDWK